jgi:methyl-accepting chemotaxis protein
MVQKSREQADALENLASGDLTPDITPSSEKDSINIALVKTIDNLNDMFNEIHQSTLEVSDGAKKIDDGAQMLSEGAMEQSTTMESLADLIADVVEQTMSNAERAEKAAKLSAAIKTNAGTGTHQMERMMTAVHEINEAGKSINKVIKVIDDIAFQTNILALNAAVEAARAGQHGKGFAVVAEEVRNLAGKSAEAAKNTDALIANSIQKAELGAQIAAETSESLQQITDGIDESTRIVEEIAGSAENQMTAIGDINNSIELVLQVVMRNTATSQESADASQRMKEQAERLQELVARFNLKDSGIKLLPS